MAYYIETFNNGIISLIRKAGVRIIPVFSSWQISWQFDFKLAPKIPGFAVRQCHQNPAIVRTIRRLKAVAIRQLRRADQRCAPCLPVGHRKIGRYGDGPHDCLNFAFVAGTADDTCCRGTLVYPAVGLRLLPAAQGTGLPVVCFIVPVVIRVCAALRSSRIPAGQTGHGVGFRTFIRRVLTDALAGMVALLHRHRAGQHGFCIKRYFPPSIAIHPSFCLCNR